MITSYRDLIAWQKAMDVVVEVYRLTGSFPPEERFGLTNQARRAAVSVPSNVAEGQGRGTTKDYVHFLRIARSSNQELETQLIIGQRLGFADPAVTDALLAKTTEVSRIISGLIRSLEATT